MNHYALVNLKHKLCLSKSLNLPNVGVFYARFLP